MVINNLDIFCTCVRPTKAQPKLVVHTNTVLPVTVTLQQLEPVSRRYTEIVKSARDLQLTELASRHRFDVRKPLNPPTVRKGFRLGTPKRYDHTK